MPSPHTKTLEIEPSFVKAYNNLGVIYYETGRLDEAIESLKKAIASSPQYTEAFYNLGIVYHGKKQYSDAVAAFKKGCRT